LVLPILAIVDGFNHVSVLWPCGDREKISRKFYRCSKALGSEGLG
jgi:hypothetical protein